MSACGMSVARCETVSRPLPRWGCDQKSLGAVIFARLTWVCKAASLFVRVDFLGNKTVSRKAAKAFRHVFFFFCWVSTTPGWMKVGVQIFALLILYHAILVLLVSTLGQRGLNATKKMFRISLENYSPNYDGAAKWVLSSKGHSMTTQRGLSSFMWHCAKEQKRDIQSRGRLIESNTRSPHFKKQLRGRFVLEGQ